MHNFIRLYCLAIIVAAVASIAFAQNKRRSSSRLMIDDLRSQVTLLREELRNCSCRRPRQMDITLLANNKVTCNDRSPAGYYIRKTVSSKRWIIYLEGGGYCYNSKMCDERRRDKDDGGQFMMSSDYWTSKKDTDMGILSPDIEKNPSWWNANAVFIPYCSSDLWSGNQSHENASNDEYVFMGSRIIAEVVGELLEREGMRNATQILLAGSSAGGIGVMLNVDKVATQIKNAGSKAEVRGISDSGWFVDHKCDCNANPGKGACSPSVAVKQGYHLWHAAVPESCAKKHSAAPWNCFFGEILYPHIKTDLFVSQWLLDIAQLEISNIPFPDPSSKREVKCLMKMCHKVRKSLKTVRSAFAPGCLSHNLLVSKDWNDVVIDGKSLPQVFDCWFPKLPGKKCTNHRYVDKCEWPLANGSCPPVYHPYNRHGPVMG